MTTTRRLYSPDGTSVEVVVLEQVEGPSDEESSKISYPPGYAPPPPSTQPRIEYLVNANGAALTPLNVPIGVRVEVDGFKRGAWLGIEIRADPSAHWAPARSTTQRVLKRVEGFPQIKVREIYRAGDDGKRQKIWETPVPFEGL